ncbi:MAG: hypothetical protein PHF63_00570 [Herbinix sp.]|nr:hypothetical protein [Herbinix sp.]
MGDIFAKLKENMAKEDIVIQELMYDEKEYNKVFSRLYDYLKRGFENKEIREFLIKFKTTSHSETMLMEIRHLITNMILWKPIIDFQGINEFDDSYIVDCTRLTKNNIKSYIDNKIIIPFRGNISIKKSNKALSELIFALSKIGSDFSTIMAMSLNVETFIDLGERYPRFDEITKISIPDDLQPVEVEKYLLDLKNEYVSIIMNDDQDNMIKPLIASGGGIKIDQLAEFGISGGLKPDLYGNTIPIVINSNFIYGGLTNLIHYYIDGLAGRKSVIMNKTVMGLSGHFSRMLNMLATTVTLNPSIDDCGSVHPIKILVKDKKILARFKGRYYTTILNTPYSVLRGDEFDLIGKIIYVRSPATCASKNGICNTCYGKMADINKNINIGGYGATKTTKKLSQDILSTKHLLKTNSQEIKFNDEFYNFFSVKGDEIVLNDELKDDIDNWKIVLPMTSLTPDEEYEGQGVSYATHYFDLVNVKTNETFRMREVADTKLIISEDFFKLITTVDKKNKERNATMLTNIDEDMIIFLFEVTNNELTKPLYSIMALLNRVEHEGCKTISEMCSKLLDLMLESGIDLLSVHAEVLIRVLIRSKSNILEFPNFTEYGPESQYQILTVLNALVRNKSVTIGLSTQDLKRQIMNPLTYLKDGTSYLDEMFK